MLTCDRYRMVPVLHCRRNTAYTQDMANLSNVSDVTRSIVKVVAICAIAVVVLIAAFRLGIVVKNIISPTPPAPPTVAFGKLPTPSFPQGQGSSTYSYAINTLTGSLPVLPDRISVYKMQQVLPNLLGLDKANGIAQKAGFTQSPTALSETTYKWNKTDSLPTTLTMNIQTFDFFLTSTYLTDPTVTKAANLPDETVAQTVSKAFFDMVMPLPQSIDPNKTKVSLFAITPSGVTPATSLSTAQLIRIDYFPQAIDTIPLYSADPTKSLVYAIIASGQSQYPQVVEAQYTHKDVATEKATYPILTSTQAFDKLKQGKGFIAANPTGSQNVTITNVSLGYYLDATPQQYLWPIIVFQGDKGFYAYVSAITDEWVQK